MKVIEAIDCKMITFIKITKEASRKKKSQQLKNIKAKNSLRVNFFLYFYATYTLFPLSTSSFFAFAEITNIFHIFFLAPKSVSWVYMNSIPHSPSYLPSNGHEKSLLSKAHEGKSFSLFLRAFQLPSSTVSCLLLLS